MVNVSYDGIVRNGVFLSYGDIIDGGVDIGHFKQRIGNFLPTEPKTWDRILLHPYESGAAWNGDQYDLRTLQSLLSTSFEGLGDFSGIPGLTSPGLLSPAKMKFTAFTTRGIEMIKRSYRLWDDIGIQYDDILEDALAEQAWTGADDLLNYTLTINSTEDPDPTNHTFVFITQVDASEFIDTSYTMHDYKPIVVQISPKVSINTHNLNTASLTNNKITATEDIGAGARSITINIQHHHPPSTASEGKGAWIWRKESTIKSQNNTWGAGTLNTGSLTIDNEASGGTVNYYLELFISNGLRSDYPGDGSNPDGLTPDRTIHVEITFS